MLAHHDPITWVEVADHAVTSLPIWVGVGVVTWIYLKSKRPTRKPDA